MVLLRKKYLNCIFIFIIALSPAVLSAQVIEVKVQGVSKSIKKNIFSNLSIYQQSKSSNLDKTRIKRLHKIALTEIDEAIKPFGYFQAKTKSFLKKKRGKWRATYSIELGRPIVITRLSVKYLGAGSKNQKLVTALSNFSLRKGQVLNQKRYQDEKDQLIRIAYNSGFLDTKPAVHRITVSKSKFSANIELQIQTGKQYYFGKITLKQNGLNSTLIDKYVPFQTGDPYRASKLLKLQNNLINSGYFSVADLSPLKDQAEDHHIPIMVKLTPVKDKNYQLGLGYGTDTGPRAQIGWTARRVNQKGHRFNSLLKISEIKDTWSNRYEIPIKNPLTDRFTLSLSYEDTILENQENETVLWGISRSVQLKSKWHENIYINYQSESFAVGQDEETTRLLVPGISWSKFQADDRINTHKGYRVLIDLKSGFGTDVLLFQSRLNTKLVSPINENMKLIARGDIALSAINKFQEVPVSLRFFTGGDHTIRGFTYNSLGPDNGGKHLLVGSVELNRSFTTIFSGALFSDVGNSVDNISDPLEHSAGFGLRWSSPIGPVRIDFAWAISQPGNPFNLHLLLGPDL